MNYTKILIAIFILFSFALKAQEVNNVRFEQIGKQIYIYYDLQGEGSYNINVYCKEDGGNKWGSSILNAHGAIGEKQIPGKGKLIIWDVLNDREKINGYIHFKIKAISSSSGTFTDNRDEKKYNWVQIGDQVWMAENLVYKTNNGCLAYEKDSSNVYKYGYLYNWQTAKIVCPNGWHLPNTDEWKQLKKFLQLNNKIGKETSMKDKSEGAKLKSTIGWESNGNGSNKYGFSALPGGFFHTSGFYNNLGEYGYWWSAEESNNREAWHYILSHKSDKLSKNFCNKTTGFSIRCIKD